MLWRFSLYGFLKNQRYFEPFLVLAFLDKGLSFFVIGLLIACREVTVNLFEVPSGAIADLWGRRRSMIVSFVAYIASFAVFGVAKELALLFVAMFLFGIGEAFRTGTHKAMIFTWLRTRGRLDERTRVYGYTRSWSKIGSAVSVVLAMVIVLASGGYDYVFYLCIAPYVLGIVNFLGYPKELEGERAEGERAGKVGRHLRSTLNYSFTRPRLRRLIFESMGFGGVFRAVKDYLQPVLKSAALVFVAAAAVKLGIFRAPAGGVAPGAGLTDAQTAAILVGPVYVVLHLLSALASRRAHRLVDCLGHEERTARVLWGLALVCFAGIGAAAWYGVHVGLIAGFVLLYVIQNFWRPVMICRVDRESAESHRATVLSIESQAKCVATMIAAPLLGLAVDLVKEQGPGGEFWPVGALGAAVALLFFVTARRAPRGQAGGDGCSPDHAPEVE